MMMSGPLPDWIDEVDARRDVVGVDRLNVELDAERLLHFRREHFAQHLVRRRNEIVPAQDVDGVGLGEHRGAVGGENSRHSGPGILQEPATRDSSHFFSSSVRVLAPPMYYFGQSLGVLVAENPR